MQRLQQLSKLMVVAASHSPDLGLYAMAKLLERRQLS
jgi:hypothetical protein